MATELLTWVSGDRVLSCRVCGESGTAQLIAEITAFDQIGLEAVRCANCGSVQLAEEPRDFSPSSRSTDIYIESGAGIGVMTEVFADVDHSPSIRLLDVGCNYPFALDVARFAYGWKVLGIEPSPAGLRGSRELGVEIRNEFLTPSSKINGSFDLILASEVVEHVTDPVGFLEAIRTRLTPGGTVLMTTPAAEIVSPLEAPNDVLLAISPGYHVFVASVKGMELLLARAGFASFTVLRDGGSLRITARTTASSEPHSVPHLPLSQDDLERYYDWRGRRSPVNSSLALGLVTRLFRLRVARGDFLGASKVLRRLYRSMRAVHGVNLRNPVSGYSLPRLEREPPWALIGAAFALGMYELLHLGRARRAASYFELCERVAALALAQSQIVDGDATDLMFQAPYHRALALAQFDPPAAAGLAMQLSNHLDAEIPGARELVASRRCRIYTELVSRGVYVIGSGLYEEVEVRALSLARDSHSDFRVAGLDAVFSLGMSALNTSNATTAADWFAKCLKLSLDAPSSPHTSGLIMSTRRHLAIARDRLAEAALASDGSAPDRLESD